VALVAGLLTLGTVQVTHAAEDAGGVAKFIGLSYDAAKAALEAAKAGKKDETAANLKQVRQLSKEITGDAAGMKLQKVNQAIKETMRILDEEKDLKKAADVLEPAVKSMSEINAESKKP